MPMDKVVRPTSVRACIGGCNSTVSAAGHRIARLMRRHALLSRAKRRYRVSLTDSNHDLPVAPNRLREAAPPTRSDAVWVADIT